MNERAKMEAPMSAAQFWWNHLTYAQREFIMKHVPPLSFITQKQVYSSVVNMHMVNNIGIDIQIGLLLQ
jgi:hypothetical protein